MSPAPRRVTVALILLAAALAASASPAAAAPPSGFQETTTFSGLSSPTVVRFASDGRVFVAEQNGRIKTWDNLFDSTPTVLADLGPKVHNFWDRGLLGFALDPQYPARPYLYVSYAHDAAIGGTAPRWGDACPNPPGATGDGCVISGRLSKLTMSGESVTAEQVLVEDWCQQYPSHSVGALAFGPDNALYMTAGDGASFNFADYGQDGNPLNPCGDPPGGIGGAMSIPSAEGGALRSQDLRTGGDPASLDGSVIRVDPDTGAGLPGNPLAGSSDPNARRIIGYGLRNPFRFTFRPGSSELWIGDVGWNTYEEINRVVNPTAGITNFGWPCREGPGTVGTYRDLNICLGLGASATDAYFAYNHSERVVAGESCPTGSSSIAGLAFYNGQSFPSAYDGALFFADYSRRCIWVMFRGSNGLPDPGTRQTFNPGAAGPVDLVVGPGGDLFYADLSGGTVRRIRYLSSNQAPVARASADPTTGTAPLAVDFDGTASSDPDPGDTLIYEWDLDGDGAFDDSSSATPTRTYAAGSTDVRLRVTDSRGVSDTSAPLTISAGAVNSPPQASITSPAASLQWRPGQDISFTGSASDTEEGTLGAARLSWSLDLRHCALDDAENCHTHHVQDFNGVAGGSFSAPDHEYPSHLLLTLTARDATGATDTETVRLDPQTVQLSFASSPPGLQLSVGGLTSTTPFTRTLIKGSANSISAPSPQSSGGQSYSFSSWSDGGARSHDIVAPDTSGTYTASFTADPGAPVPGLVAALGFDELSGTSVTDSSGTGNGGTILGATRTVAGRFGGALSFDGINDWVTIADSASLDLTSELTLEAWVRPTIAADSAWRTVLLKEQPGNLTYALYGNSDSSRPSSYVYTGSDQGTSGSAALAANTWTHLATTYGGGQLRLYVNGTQVASRALTGAVRTSTGALRIGGNAVWPEWFQGQIDEVRVYDRVLSAPQVQADMNAPVGAPPPPDGQPPSAPASLTATGSLGQANLSWGASTDNVGVARYNVHRSTSAGFTPSAANRIAQVTGTTRTDTGLAAGTYYYRVIAEDAAGNLSPPSPQAAATVSADTTAPTVALSAPANGATVSGSVAVSANSSDDVGVTGVQFKLDGQNLGAEDTSAPYGTTWNTTTASAGAHVLSAVARDAAGNLRTSASVNVTVDNSVPAPTGLVAAFAFNELSGTSVTDSSGSGNAGTILGATRTVAGRYGSALSFDGVNDWVTVADSASLDLTSAMTLEAWVRPTTADGEWRTALLKEQPGNLAYSLYSGTDNGGPAAYVHAGGAERGTPGAGGLPVNTWTHLAATYGGGQLRLFVNGTQVVSRAQTGNILVSGGALRIGGNAVWPEWFAGQIDDVRVYNRALSAAQIGADMNTPVAP